MFYKQRESYDANTAIGSEYLQQAVRQSVGLLKDVVEAGEEGEEEAVEEDEVCSSHGNDWLSPQKGCGKWEGHFQTLNE